MAVLTREQILGADDRLIETVAVPEWGGEVLVRRVSAGERDKLEASMVVQSGRRRTVSLENTRARIVALCVCDAEGRPLFSESDVEALAAKSAAAMERVFDHARAMNRFSESDVEDLAKNSERIPSSDSPSD